MPQDNFYDIIDALQNGPIPKDNIPERISVYVAPGDEIIQIPRDIKYRTPCVKQFNIKTGEITNFTNNQDPSKLVEIMGYNSMEDNSNLGVFRLDQAFVAIQSTEFREYYLITPILGEKE